VGEKARVTKRKVTQACTRDVNSLINSHSHVANDVAECGIIEVCT